MGRNRAAKLDRISKEYEAGVAAHVAKRRRMRVPARCTEVFWNGVRTFRPLDKGAKYGIVELHTTAEFTDARKGDFVILTWDKHLNVHATITDKYDLLK